ncbi:MAG: glycosyltransferase [Xenococcaceae cyanobacterium MO_188.B19]|nr:glycosyltransferase [Xenococcaceae cyanobacterium MO_188.B19]
MSVAFIAHYLGPRLGIGQYIERLLPPLVEELTSKGVQVTILASPNAIAKTPALGELSEIVQVLPPLDYAPGKRYAWVATRFAGYCRHHKIQTVVWLSNPIVLPWHPPTIAVIHDVNEWKAANKYGDRIKTWLRAAVYLDATLRFAQKIIVVSETTQEELLHFRPASELKSKVTAIANGSDSQLINLPAVAINAPKAPFLLSVGRIDPKAKCLPEAVALVSALREISEQPWELHLVGGMNTSTKDSGEAFLKSLQNQPWVSYHGYLGDRDLAQWYRQATAVVFLSENEGFGLPIVEAMSFNRWIIVNQMNQASLETGGSAIIPVTITNFYQSAKKLLDKLQHSPFPVAKTNGQQWQNTARAYAREILNLIPFLKSDKRESGNRE